ncbi:hypothetical protein [Flavihumibacter petaseus]|uniref:Uncharacterized protein n=1 Tax=Flavihumibacter petaseus NBRC 106054 TaxID=1220578 RepID=A0A0E9N2D4_9BACT|nr:hypothetical protein [Flavihumibacter petaseus]GAO43831.1 hypothetical protein FPE01S_02_09370 [Flavihumibacter petaseus NBRC 106054]
MTNQKLLKAIAARLDYSVTRNSCLVNYGPFLAGFYIDRPRKDYFRLYFELNSLISDRYINTSGDLPATISIPCLNQQGMVRNFRWENAEADLPEIMTFIDSFREQYGLLEQFHYHDLIRLCSDYKQKNHDGLLYFLAVDQFLLFVLSTCRSESSALTTMEKLTENLLATPEDIVRASFYSDYDAWKGRVTGVRTNQDFVRENQQLNTSSFSLENIRKMEFITS